MKRALLVIDLQNDFYENGSLPVKEASSINQEINTLMKDNNYHTIIASQDWHPTNHQSFAVNHKEKPFTPYNNQKGIGPLLWPVHCLQGTSGAEFHTNIDQCKFNYIIRKGTKPDVDSYSAFSENDGTDLGLTGLLKGLKINEVDVCGLALDYCVKYTALDAIKNGFKTTLLLKASKGVNQDKNNVKDTLNELSIAGVKISK